MNNIELTNLPVYNMFDYHYDTWFESIRSNGNVLNVMQRRELVKMIDLHVEQNEGFLSLIVDSLNTISNNNSDYNVVEREILSAWMFISQTTADCLVLCKYYLIADTGYDRRLMRGKLKVIMNEGIKKLIGFAPNAKKDTVWESISSIMKHFPGSAYQQQYNELGDLLRKHASSSSWWKDCRDAETHLDALYLYITRQEDLSESVVMIESLQLVRALDAVDHFLNNLHAGLTNWLTNQYRNHPEQFK